MNKERQLIEQIITNQQKIKEQSLPPKPAEVPQKPQEFKYNPPEKPAKK